MSFHEFVTICQKVIIMQDSKFCFKKALISQRIRKRIMIKQRKENMHILREFWKIMYLLTSSTQTSPYILDKIIQKNFMLYYGESTQYLEGVINSFENKSNYSGNIGNYLNFRINQERVLYILVLPPVLDIRAQNLNDFGS